MRIALAALVLCLAVGLSASVVAFKAHESDGAFVLRQQHPLQIVPLEVETAVMKAPQPVASGRGSAAVSASCTPGTSAPMRNPWLCSVHYASGRTIRYRIVFDLSGSFRGVDRTGQFVLRGTIGRSAATGA